MSLIILKRLCTSRSWSSHPPPLHVHYILWLSQHLNVTVKSCFRWNCTFMYCRGAKTDISWRLHGSSYTVSDKNLKGAAYTSCNLTHACMHAHTHARKHTHIPTHAHTHTHKLSCLVSIQKLKLLIPQSYLYSPDSEPTPRCRGPVSLENPGGEEKKGHLEDQLWPRSMSPGGAWIKLTGRVNYTKITKLSHRWIWTFFLCASFIQYE